MGKMSDDPGISFRAPRNVTIGVEWTVLAAVCGQRGLVGYASYLPAYDPGKGVDLTTRAFVLRVDGDGNFLGRRDVGAGWVQIFWATGKRLKTHERSSK